MGRRGLVSIRQSSHEDERSDRPETGTCSAEAADAGDQMVWEKVGRKHVRNRAEAGVKKSRESKQCGDDVEIPGKNRWD